MNPKIDDTSFGSITIGGTVYTQDVIVRYTGEVVQRGRSLSDSAYNAAYALTLAEAKRIYEKGAQRLIIGTGQFGLIDLSKEAAEYFSRQGCKAELLPTPKAAEAWNGATGAVIGLFPTAC